MRTFKKKSFFYLHIRSLIKVEPMINTKIKELYNPQSMGYAKISREKLRSFAKGNLNLTKNATNLILGMSKYVDSTSRIVISLEQLSRELNMQRKTFNHVIALAKFNGLIYKKNGAYYSNFHVITTGENSTMDYISPLDEFSSATFLNMTLNQQRLLSYILTSSLPGTLQTYNIVKLYNNKMKKKRLSKEEDSGLDIFPTLKDLLKNLAVLIKNDQVEVILRNGSIPTFKLTGATKGNIEETLLNHFGFSETGKTSRINYLSFGNELIGIKISKRLCNQNSKVIASEYELEQFALSQNFSAYNLGVEQMNYLIGIKNTLIRFAGETGAEIYRRVIKKFFKEKKELIVSYAEKDKATNYFVDYYLLPEICSILKDAALHQNIMSSVKTNFKEILTNGYILPVKDVCSLLAFYIHKGSDNHLLQLDKEIFKRAIQINKFTDNNWVTFNNKINQIKYDFKLLTVSLQMTIADKNQLLYVLADNHLLTQQDKIEEILKKLQNKESVVDDHDIRYEIELNKLESRTHQLSSPNEIVREFKDIFLKNL